MQLYRGTIKIFSNWTTSLEEGLALTEDKLKEQVAVPELGTMFMLCDNSTLHTHIPNISVLPTRNRMEEAASKFPELPAGVDVTRQETLMSFFQIKSSMNLHKRSTK